MDREALNFFLRAGPSRKFDVGYFSRRPGREDSPSPLLFAMPFLNDALLFKFVSAGPERADDNPRLVATLVFLPQDRDRPADGGEAFLFTHDNLARYCGRRADEDGVNDAAIAADGAALAALDSIPTFSPFLIELAYRRAGLTISPAYLQLAPELRTTLSGLLKSRIRPLIVAAYNRDEESLERAVEGLTAKLFCTSELQTLLPLVRALRLPPADAQDILTSWLGIAYFEYEFAQIHHKLTDLSNWLTLQEQQHMQRARQDREYIQSVTASVKGAMSRDWGHIMEITNEYKTSYEGLIFNGEVDGFINFLNRAVEYYWNLGGILGRLEQTVVVWRHYVRRFRDQALPDSVYFEFLDLLRRLYFQANPTDGLTLASLGLWEPSV